MKKTYKIFAFLIFALSCIVLLGCNGNVKLKVATQEYNLAEGEKQQISVSVENYDKEVAFTYSSSDESVASVENVYIVLH